MNAHIKNLLKGSLNGNVVVKFELNGARHRQDGPAIEVSSGYKQWWLNGKLHREDGAAVKYLDGTKEWFLNGIKYSEEVYWKALDEYSR